MEVDVRTRIVELRRCNRHAAMDVRRDVQIPKLIIEVRDLVQ
jgi:hypothetical protein